MKRKPHSRRKRTSTKSVLRLPDLEHAKTAVLNSLTSLDAQRGYRHAIDEFVDCGLDQPLMIVLASSRILELGDGCGRVADHPPKTPARSTLKRLLSALARSHSLRNCPLRADFRKQVLHCWTAVQQTAEKLVVSLSS